MDSQIKIWDLKVGLALGVQGGGKGRWCVGGVLGLVPSRVFSLRCGARVCWSGLWGIFSEVSSKNTKL